MVTADEARRELARRELESRRAQQPAPADDYDNSWFAQLASGANEGVARALGAPIDLMNDIVVTPAIHGVNAIAGTNFQPAQEPLGGSGGLVRSLQDLGSIKPPTDDPYKQFGRNTTAEVSGAALTGVGALARAAIPALELGKIGLAGIGSSVGGAVANHLAPDNPYADFLAKSLGGRIASGPLEMGRHAARQINEAIPTIERRRALMEALYEAAGDIGTLSTPAAVDYMSRAIKSPTVKQAPLAKAPAKRSRLNRIWEALTAGQPAAIAD
ncbi:hypothetical protein [Mesorhizobium amorphae]|uniref:hypothetical protein n=1 Tax=Mesorhizobium amorphae TaxID=71433 RepID=UPI0011827CE2|nr:hypothetical protein [Mesorhizobium amorphae]